MQKEQKKEIGLSMECKINISGLIEESITDGPGIRFVLFTQGCPRRCAGCHNPHTQPIEGGTLYEWQDVFDKIKRNPLLDGVTFSGGEPMIQAEALLPLAKEIKNLGLNLAIYTGYTFEELQNSVLEGAVSLLQTADILIDGAFKEDLRDYNLKFKGSTNQRVIDLSKTFQNNEVVIITDDKWN